MGYHLTGTNFNNPEFEAIEQSKTYAGQIPDVLLVRKVYPRRKKNKTRNWRLRRMAREEGEMLPRKQDQAKEELDYEQFLRDVEEDPELRQTVNLYKQQQQQAQQKKKTEAMEGVEGMDGVEMDADVEDENEEEDSDGDDGLEVPLDQLIDEFDEMTVRDNA